MTNKLVKRIRLVPSNGPTFEISIEDARQLYKELHEMFGDKEVPRPDVTPNIPPMPDVTPPAKPFPWDKDNDKPNPWVDPTKPFPWDPSSPYRDWPNPPWTLITSTNGEDETVARFDFGDPDVNPKPL